MRVTHKRRAYYEVDHFCKRRGHDADKTNMWDGTLNIKSESVRSFICVRSWSICRYEM